MITGTRTACVPLSLLKGDLTLLQLKIIIALLGVDAPDDHTRIVEAAKAAGTTDAGLRTSLQPLVDAGFISLSPLNLVGVLGTSADKGVVVLAKKKPPTPSAHKALYPLVMDKVAGSSYSWATLVKQMVKDHNATIELLAEFIEYKYNSGGAKKPVYTSDVVREYPAWIRGGKPRNRGVTVESILRAV